MWLALLKLKKKKSWKSILKYEMPKLIKYQKLIHILKLCHQMNISSTLLALGHLCAVSNPIYFAGRRLKPRIRGPVQS
jgi:hypothetical protein